MQSGSYVGGALASIYMPTEARQLPWQCVSNTRPHVPVHTIYNELLWAIPLHQLKQEMKTAYTKSPKMGNIAELKR